MNARTVALPLLALGVAAALWWQMAPPGSQNVPAATWRVGPTDDFAQARNYDELAAETPIRLSFTCTEARHAYVFSHSREDGTLLLFPSPDVESDVANPLPPGRSVLPGKLDGKPLSWSNRAEIRATTTFVVVASQQPIAELEALLPKLRRWSNKVLPDRSMQVTKPAGVESIDGAPGTELPAAVLRRAAARSMSETQINGPLHPDQQLAGVWSASFRVKEKAGK
ncbi:MAG: hypothetical protein ACE37K_23155 [Planctomycetota bacterium]